MESGVFGFQKYAPVGGHEQVKREVVEGLQNVIKIRKKSTNMKRVMRGILGLMAFSEEFREGIVLVIKEILICYLKLTTVKSTSQRNVS